MIKHFRSMSQRFAKCSGKLIIDKNIYNNRTWSASVGHSDHKICLLCMVTIDNFVNQILLNCE